MLIGAIAGVLCFFACSLKFHFGYDDSLNVVGIHGSGGKNGALLTGVFACPAVNAAATGLLYANPSQPWNQFVSVAATMVNWFVVAFILFQIVDTTIGLRPEEEDEDIGLDLSQHGKNA